MNSLNRLKFLRIAICVGLLAGIFFSFELWFSISRTFPRVPLFVEVPILFDRILSIILVLSLISLIFLHKTKIILLTTICSLGLLVFFDQMRLQPWVYQYFLLLVIFALKKDESNSNQTLGLAQIIIAGLYFWSGLQKLNFTFSQETLPKLLAPFENLFPLIELPFVFIGISIALIETLIGCGLLFRKTRNFAVGSAVFMHTMILILLVAKDFNNIVWIWNATLILLVVIGFWKSDVSLRETIKNAAEWRAKIAKTIAAASVLLPILSFFGLWDMYLSGALYSGNVRVAVIRVDEDLIENLPPKARKVIFQNKTGEAKMLPLFEWAIAELNVPAVPEPRIFRQIAFEICRYANEKSEIELIVKERPAILDGSYEITRSGCREFESALMRLEP